MHRGIPLLIAVAFALVASSAHAGDEEKRVINGVLSGLMGQPQTAPDAAYLAKERDLLVGMLQSGQYATSRQGETVDAMILGIPLTKSDRVYTARPIPPSQTTQ